VRLVRNFRNVNAHRPNAASKPIGSVARQIAAAAERSSGINDKVSRAVSVAANK
jgi:hypothetical protein